MIGTDIYSSISPIYNTINAALSVAGPNYLGAQRIIGALGVLALPMEIGTLVEQFDQYHKDKSPQVKQRNYRLTVAAGVAVAALAGIIAYVGLTRFRAPSGNLTELLVKGLSLSPEAAKQVQVSWQMPFVDRMLLLPKLVRLGVNLGILTFSNDKKTALLNCGLQAFTLFQMAGVPRIKMDVVLPVKGQLGIKEAHTEIYAILPSSKGCSNPNSHLENSLKGIYAYAQNLFEGSQWKLYEVTQVQNGVATGKWLRYNITVQEPIRTVCDCNQNFYLDVITGWTYNFFFNFKAEIRVPSLSSLLQ